jgi:hypothetical protein
MILAETGIPVDQISELVKLGLPWPLLILAGYWLVKKDKEIADLANARIEDLKKIADLTEKNTEMLATWVAANDARTRALEQTSETQRLEAAAISGNTEALGRLSEVVARAMESNYKMREALLSAGVKLG